MEKKNKTVGMRIKEAREEKGWTTAQLASRLEVSITQKRYYESGVTIPSFLKMAKIADVFDISLDWFALGLEEEGDG